MPDAYVIQVGGRTAGIVARDTRDHTFNFFASRHEFNALEGCRFTDPLAAERAALHLLRHGNLPRAKDPEIPASLPS
ncbi:MAG TPA: hypothetical protein VEQ35_05150 [Beijerinckia sp.]|jgi:hypothetical protein|nr:hypothetical protein [Beijerinckia sp.]